MFERQKFVTNSSSTSFIGFGVCLDRDELRAKNIDYWDAPEGIDTACSPSDFVYLYIPQPDLSIDAAGILHFPDSAAIQDKYLTLKNYLKEIGIDQKIGPVEDCWYDG
jgi:hypothetical protein